VFEIFPNVIVWKFPNFIIKLILQDSVIPLVSIVDSPDLVDPVIHFKICG
jgi:hypothetical protein